MARRYGLFALVLVLGLAAAGRDQFDGWVAATKLPPVLTQTSVEMRDRHGALMRVFPVENGRQRLALRLSDVDPGFIEMLLAYEDKRFFDHHGVDYRAMMRAGYQALTRGKVVSGGSTLTMQVARLLENSGTGKWQGKLRQIRLALALERKLSKAEILELYLLHAPYGGGLEGLRAGALAWFGKEPARLSPEEAALLVALPQSPERRRPDRFAKAATDARNRVLARVGARKADHRSAVPNRLQSFVRLAPHLADQLTRADPLARRIDVTLDAGLQRHIETLVQRAVAGQPAGVSAAIMVADHQTSEVLAQAGSPAYSGQGGALGFVDMTAAVRSPGSTLKPFVYALAFDQGLAHPDTLINDAPVVFDRYAPQNFDGQFRGEVTVRDALQLSLNIPPILLTHELGPARLMAALRAGGAQPEVPGQKPGLAVALGGLGLSLRDLVQLYAGLANGGKAVPLRWRMDAAQQPAKDFLAPTAAWQVSHILAGLSPPVGLGQMTGDIAYKTGTSYGHRDAWAVGFDGRHVIGVWLGRPDGTPVPGAFGGEQAAPILFEAFGRLGSKRIPLPLPPADALILSTAQLPPPLQRFKGRDAVFEAGLQSPVLIFPPMDARLRHANGGVPLKLRAGVLPLTVMVNGHPQITGLQRREALVKVDGPGFVRVTVVDANGQSAEVRFRLD